MLKSLSILTKSPISEGQEVKRSGGQKVRLAIISGGKNFAKDRKYKGKASLMYLEKKRKPSFGVKLKFF